jgi:hypothetical protein
VLSWSEHLAGRIHARRKQRSPARPASALSSSASGGIEAAGAPAASARRIVGKRVFIEPRDAVARTDEELMLTVRGLHRAPELGVPLRRAPVL